MKHELAQMRAQKRGTIVNTASIAAMAGHPGRCAYAASKHGVIGLTKTAALEFVKMGIRVNAVCPSAVDTPMFDRALQRLGNDMKERIMNNEPMQRMATAEEVAQAAVWLCSDEASFVNGHALMVDGGMLARLAR